MWFLGFMATFINIALSCQSVVRIFIRDVAFGVFQQNTVNILLIASEIAYDFVYETPVILISVIVVITKKITIKYTFNSPVHMYYQA